MIYRLIINKTARKQLKKLDEPIRYFIYSYIKKNLYDTQNPRLHGKALVNLNGLWSYRVGVYRIIAQIVDEELLVLLININHRKEVYKRNR